MYDINKMLLYKLVFRISLILETASYIFSDAYIFNKKTAAKIVIFLIDINACFN